MRITKLYYTKGDNIQTISGTPEKLCELIKLDGYYTNKKEALAVIKNNINRYKE